MNKFYKVVFCKATGVMKAVSETAKSGKKTKSVSVAAGVLAAGVMFSTAAMAAVNDPVLSGETTGNAIAVGQTNTVDGANSTAVGHDNEVVGDDHTILGSNNNAGNFDNSYYDYDTDEWVDSVENFNNNTIVGNQNETRGNNSIAVGVSNRVENSQVTVTGGDNHVDTENSGAYGQYNKVGTSNVAPQFFRVDDGSESGRQMRRYGLQEGGSYAYGNANEAIGNQNHVVGNDNRLGADTSGVLGNGNNLRNEYFEEPTFLGLDQYSRLGSNGSFLVGNDNDVDGNNTHAMGNANNIVAERNVTLGNANYVRVDNNNGFGGGFDRAGDRQLNPNQNTSTAIVGEANSLTAAGVHIVGTNNDVEQAYSYVVGGGNTVESGDNGFLPFDETNTTNGSNLLGSDNYIESNSASVLGNSNRVGYNSPMTTVAGSQNFTDGISTSTVGTANSIEKDVGGAHGTLNRVAGNYGIISAIEDALRSEVFEGIDLDGDGIIDVTDPEQAMQIVMESGSYAFGNINNLKGEGAHAVGNSNEFSGDSNKGIGNKNRIGQVGGMMVGDGDAITPTIVFNDSAAYGDNNVIDGNSSQSIGNVNAIASDRTSVVGYDNEVDSNDGQVVGNTNTVDGDSASLVGSDNTVIGTGNGVLGDSNKLGIPRERYGDGDFQFYVAQPVSDSYAVGKENTILGNDSHTIGNGNKSESQTIFIAGTNNDVNSHNSSVTGHNNRVVKTDEEGETRYNSDVSVSGNYNSVQESNVFVGGNSNTVAAYGGGAVGNYNTVGQEGGRYYEYYDEMRETTGSYALGNQNSVYGSNSFSVGTNNLVDGDNSHVLGAENSQQADLSTVVGSYNYAGEKAFGSIIVSQGSNVHGAGAISVGIINNISKDKSGAFGALNTITGTPEFADYMKNEDMAGMQYQFTTGSYATGNLNNLEGDSSHIVGNSNTVNGKKTNVVGNSNEVTANDSFIGGNDNTVEGNRNGAIGSNNALGGLVNDSLISVKDSYAIGNKNQVLGNESAVVGIDNIISEKGFNSFIMGQSSRINAESGTVAGSGNVIFSDYSGSFGNSNVIGLSDEAKDYFGIPLDQVNNPKFSYALGNGNSVESSNAHTVGNNNSISGDKSSVFGSFSEVARGSENVAVLGNENITEGKRTNAVGSGNTVTGNKTTAIGALNTVTANNASVIGSDNTVEADDVLVLGNNNTLGAGTDGSIILGSNASSTVAGGIAIGNNSVVDRANSVSVGSVGAERQITNVADATEDKDAVNFGQLKAKITDTTAGKNIAVKRTDTGYEVSTVEDMTLTSVTTGDTILNNAGLTNGATTVGAAGLKVGDVTVSNVGLDNAGNRVTSVGDATLRSDAVNYGQFTDGLAGTIKSVTGDENVVATTDAEKNVILNLNKDLNVDRVTTGNTSFNTDGVRAGDVFLSSTTGLDNAGNRVTSVGDAIIRSDAVNYGQFTDGLANTIKSVTGDENITATTDEDKNVVVTLNKDLVADSLTTGTTIVNTDGVRAGDVFLSNTGLDNGGNRVTSVGNAVEDSDAVNFGQFKAGITDTTAGKNITVKRTDTGYEVATVEDMTLTSVTTGNTVINNAGFTNGATTVGNTGLKVGDVTVSNVGLDNAGNRVTSVGDATLRSDAVNYGQFTDGMANTIKSVTGDENVVATTDAEKNVSLVLNRDLNVDSVTVGSNVFDSSGLKIGNVSIGDEVGIYAGNMTVSGVADAVNADDAVNLGQVSAIDDRLTNENIAQNTNITNNTNAINQGFNVGNGVTSNKFDLGDTVDITAGKNAKVTTTATGVEVSVADDLVVTSVTAGTSSFNTDGFRAGDVLVGNTGINNAGFRVSGVGDAINRDDAVNYGQFQDGLNGIKKTTIDGDTNIIATSNETGYDLSLGADLTADSLTTGNTVVNTDGLKVGDVTVSSGGLNNAGNRVTNVGDAIEDADAVNFKQFKAGMTDTTASGNLTATRTETGYDVAMNDTISLVGVNTGSTSMTTDGVRAGDVFLSSANGLYNAGNKVTGVGDATERDDAVNYGQFQDGLNGLTKTTVDGDANITATKNATGYDVTLNQDVTLSSVTTGVTSIDNSGLKVGDVTVSSAGLDNAGNRVTSVGDAIIRSDAVNYGQFTDGMANTIKSVTGDENIIATTDAERNVILNLKKDIVVDSMTAGNTLINNNGMTIGDSFFGATGVRTGDVILSSTSGLYNGGYRVTGVDRAVEGTDAVNFDQFNEALNNIAPTNIKGDANITVTNTGAGYDIGLNKDLTADSVTTGGTTVSNAGLTTGDVTVSNSGLSNGGNRVTNIGDAVEGSDAVSFDQFNKKFDDMTPTDIKGDSNITVTKTDTGFDIGLNKDITADSVTVGNTSITNDGLTVGNVSVTAGGLNNGGNTVKGVGDGVLRDDAVNKGQLDDLEVRQNIKNEAQDIIINNKLDRDEFLKDQERQDALLEGKADKAELDKTNVNVSNNTTNISKNSDILKDHEKELGRLEDVKADKAELDKTNIKVQDNADKNKEQDKVLGDHKTELDRLEDVKADKSDLEAKADKTYVDKEITATNDRFSEINKENNAKFDKFEKSQNTIDSSQNVRIDRNEQAIADLGYQVDNLEGKLSAGIASSVAMASMPSSFIKGEARIAGGFGYYNGQNAVAIGITGATETGDYSYKLGSSYTQEGGAVVGAGISYRLW